MNIELLCLEERGQVLYSAETSLEFQMPVLERGLSGSVFHKVPRAK